MLHQIIYYYLDLSFDYPTGYGYATEHILDPCGFEVEIDHKTDTIDIASVKGFGDLFDEVEAHKNTPQQFIKWLAVSKRWINAGDRDGNTNKEILEEITEMIQNSLLERTA